MSIVSNTAYHLTRSSYKRKIITFGVSIFASLSLIATGFASWVLSTDASDNKDGNVDVGAVTESSIEIKDLAFDSETGDTVSFNPKEGDKNGTVRAATDDTVFENMSIKFSATITNISVLDDLTVKLTVPAGVKAAADAGYIVLPESVSDTGVLVIDGGNLQTDNLGGDAWTWVKAQDKDEATFTYTLNFTWGAEFGNANPGEYFDTEANYADKIPDGTSQHDYIKGELYNFRSLILTGKAYTDPTLTAEEKALVEGSDSTPNEKFNVVVTATVN
jgi:hypothetical protein